MIPKHNIPTVKLLHVTPLKVAELAARVCYDSFEQSEHELIRNYENSGKDIPSSDILNKLSWVFHHESVMEHINLSFYIKKIPRNVVLELNRHRLISTSQKSSRYTLDVLINAYVKERGNFEANGFRECVENNISVSDTGLVTEICDYLWNCLEVLNKDEELIANLTGSKKKAQNDRVKVILPECWVMDGIWTINLRSLKNFLDLRSNGAAYYGIREVADAIIDVIPGKYLELIRKG